MAETGYIRSENKLVIAGNPLDVEMEIEEAGMLPGMLVMLGTSTYKIKKCDAAHSAIGWLGYEKSPIAFRPKDMDTAYNVGDSAAVVHGPGMTLRAYIGLEHGTAITSGTKLIALTGGMLTTWIPVPDGGATGEVAVEAMAVEDGDNADANLLVRSEI